jgi:hypothetical protein
VLISAFLSYFPFESTSLGGNAVAALPVITVMSVAVPRG